jgi:hypothetical protein
MRLYAHGMPGVKKGTSMSTILQLGDSPITILSIGQKSSIQHIQLNRMTHSLSLTYQAVNGATTRPRQFQTRKSQSFHIENFNGHI